MAALRKLVTGALTLAAATAIGGCGGGSKAQDDGGGRAQYAVQSNLFCESLRTELQPRPRPLTHPQLGSYLERADDAMRAAATGLHDARRTLAAAATPQIRAFDRQVDATVAVTARLSDEAARSDFNPGRDEQRALIKQADRTRRAFTTLRRSGRAAGLRRCGLGGDDLAEAVLFTTYRTQYLRIQDATFRSLRRTPFRRSDSLARYLSKSSRYLKVRAAEYRRVRRLTPPAELRAAHGTLVARFARAIEADRQLQSAFHDGRLNAISSATGLLQRMDNRYFSAERRLRRLLDGRGAA